ncbi:MAG: hypothetical protein QM655_05585 [Nocardioidaceae bacterium]
MASTQTSTRESRSVPVGPVATRVKRPSWRDPRLAVGVAIVAGCGLLGATLLAGADNTIAVWSLSHDVAAGQPLTDADVTTAHVRFTSSREADRYLDAAQSLPHGTGALSDLKAGELLPRAAIGDTSSAELVELPITLPSSSVPATARVGSRLDVWVTAPDATRAKLLLDDVAVVSLPQGSSSSLSPSSTRQVIVGLDSGQAAQLPRVIAALASGTVALTRQAG